MKGLLYSQIAAAANGHLIGEDGYVVEVGIDSRQEKKLDLFVAIKGDRFDGHDFVAAAINSGAKAIMVEQQHEVDVPQIIVPDGCKALGDIARLWRQQFAIPVVAVTGSNGKTTVKEMLSSIFGQHHSVLATHGNLNNHIGVPLTLLRLREQHQYAVIEMGANHHGEIKYLTGVAQPDVALITNAGPAHLEGFKSIEGVAQAKAEIFLGLTEKGTAVINADDSYASFWLEKTQHCSQVEFTMQKAKPAPVKGNWIDGGNTLVIKTETYEIDINLPVPGIHNAQNALAAAAVALTTGITIDEIKQGLELMEPVAGRLNPRQGVNGIKILDDTYNANPASLKAALEVIDLMPGESWLILGDMAELGKNAEDIHADMGTVAKRYNVRQLFTLGELGSITAKNFGTDAKSFNDPNVLAQAVRTAARPGVNVLVKGSRSMRMERVVEALLELNSDNRHSI